MASGASGGGTSLYVGNLDPRVYRELLEEIFSLAGKIVLCHVVFDKVTGVSNGFGFVEFEDHATASAAMEKFNGCMLYGRVLTIDWARAGVRDSGGRTLGKNEDPASQYCLFVGNLAMDVTDDQLLAAFSEFGSCSSAKCAREPGASKNLGYAFVSFRERAHAQAAIEGLDGQVLSGRPLRVDWSKGKTNAATRAASMGLPELGVGMSSASRVGPTADKLSFETVRGQTPIGNITAYVSGLPVSISDDTLRERFGKYGQIQEIRIPESVKALATDKLYAFVRFVDHDSAARAICDCQGGTEVAGNQVTVYWGRESVRRNAPMPMMGGRGPVPMASQHGYGGGYPQQQPHGHYPQHAAAPGYPNQYRPPYAAQQVYGRSPAPQSGPPGVGPMHHAPQHLPGQQQRYRPY